MIYAKALANFASGALRTLELHEENLRMFFDSQSSAPNQGTTFTVRLKRD